MAIYRTYKKNGITGHRYQGLYIVKGEKKGDFKILNEDGSLFKDTIPNFDECVWIIDKETSDKESLEILNRLYELDISQLTGLMAKLQEKEHTEGLIPSEKSLLSKVLKIRNRKIKDKPF